jgi:hypothetical protein
MKPTGRLLDGAEYIPALKTNVQATWRKFGWVPPSEQKQKIVPIRAQEKK